MKKYVKKPVVVNAFKWDGNPQTLDNEIKNKPLEEKHFVVKGHTLYIKALEGLEKCKIGDMVIKGVHGEFYPCEPRIFKETYRKAKEI